MQIKNNKGSITLITLISVVFLLTFLISTYLIINSKANSQLKITKKTIELYNNGNKANEIYNSYFGDIIPIYTPEQLLAIGTNQKIIINNKIYEFSYNRSYILMKDINVTGSNTWVPLTERTDNEGNNLFTGSLEENGHVIIQGNIAYSNKNTNNTQEVTKTFTINVAQEGSIVKINGVEQTSVYVLVGSTVTWEVSKDGYETQTGSYTMLASDYTKNVILKEYFDFTINVLSPSNTTVIIKKGTTTLASGTGSQTATILEGETATYTVSNTINGYATISKSQVITENTTIDIRLTKYVTCKLSSFTNTSYQNLLNGGSISISASRSLSGATRDVGYGVFNETTISTIPQNATISKVSISYSAKKSSALRTDEMKLTLCNGTSSTNIISTKMNETTDSLTTTSKTYARSIENWSRIELTDGVLVHIRYYHKGLADSTITLSNVSLVVYYIPAEDFL